MTCEDCLHFIVCDALESNGIEKIHPIQCGCFEDKEKVKAALEKQIPKKPTPQVVKGGKALIGNGWWCEGTTVYRCPCCNELISRIYDYCYKCGQALEWGDGK